MQKKSWFRWGQNCWNSWSDSVWLCIFYFPLCTSKGIKDPFELKSMGLAHWSSLVSLCQSFSLSLPLPLLFRLIPWSMEAPSVLLSAWVSKTQSGRRSAPSLPQETGRAPVASVNRANFLSRSFIGFLCKPRNICLFLSSIFLSSTFFPYLCLNQSLILFLLRVSLDPAGAGPRQFYVYSNLFCQTNWPASWKTCMQVRKQ